MQLARRSLVPVVGVEGREVEGRRDLEGERAL